MDRLISRIESSRALLYHESPPWLGITHEIGMLLGGIRTSEPPGRAGAQRHQLQDRPAQLSSAQLSVGIKLT